MTNHEIADDAGWTDEALRAEIGTPEGNATVIRALAARLVPVALTLEQNLVMPDLGAALESVRDLVLAVCPVDLADENPDDPDLQREMGQLVAHLSQARHLLSGWN